METAMATETTTESPITIVPVEGKLDLHQHYRGQSGPQDCRVVLDTETGKLWAEYDPQIGPGTPARMYHGIQVAWSIPALKAEAANALLKRILPYAERIYAGTTTEWDGHNHVGRADADADEAEEEVAGLIEASDLDSEYNRVSIWDAGDWYGGAGDHEWQRREMGIDAATTDAELAAIEEEAEAEAASEGVDALEGLAEHLATLRDEAFGELVEAVDAASEYVQDDAALKRWLRMRLADGATPDAAALAAELDAADGA